MKTKRTQRLRIVLGLCLFVTAGLAAPLFAQSTTTMVAKIPFEFVVRDQTLPAGEYIVQHGSFHPAIQIQSKNLQGPIILTMSMSVVRHPVPEADSQLLFHRYGDTYFLSQVWWAGTINGQEVRKSKLERELAQGKSGPQVAYITARSR